MRPARGSYPCGREGCDYVAKSPGQLGGHRTTHHPPQLSADERERRRGGWSPLDRLGLSDMSQAVDEDGVAIGLPIRAVMQEHEHSPKMPGDCLRACVAAILGLERDDVPHFARYGLDDPEPDHGGWWFALVGFCALLEPSWDLRQIDPLLDALPSPSSSRADLFGMYLAVGKSPRGGVSHVVVARGGHTIWDPHPSRAGIEGEPTDAFVLTLRDSAPDRDDTREPAGITHPDRRATEGLHVACGCAMFALPILGLSWVEG